MASKKRLFVSMLALMCLALFSTPALAQGKGKGKGKKDKTRIEKVEKSKGKKGEKGKKGGKPEHAGKPDHAGKENAPGQIKKETGEHPGGKALGKKKEHPGKGKMKGKVKAKKAKAKTKKSRVANEQNEHIERMAKIKRLEVVGKEKNDEKLVARAAALREKEKARHDKAMDKARKDKKEKKEKQQ